MSYQHITVEREERLCIVTINRPDVMNALNPQTHAEMARAFDAYVDDVKAGRFPDLEHSYTDD